MGLDLSPPATNKIFLGYVWVRLDSQFFPVQWIMCLWSISTRIAMRIFVESWFL